MEQELLLLHKEAKTNKYRAVGGAYDTKAHPSFNATLERSLNTCTPSLSLLYVWIFFFQVFVLYCLDKRLKHLRT